MKFIVSVEKRLYATGTVEINCDTIEHAIELVESKIDNGELQTTAIEWDDPQYEDMSFMTTGDVDN